MQPVQQAYKMEGKNVVLDQNQIKELLPHREPMLLVDTVEELDPGQRVVTTFYVSHDRDIFRGHFPGEPVLPGVYTVECMAQAADILLLSRECYRGLTPLFLGINNVRFRRKVLPGDTLTIRASLLSERPEKMIATCAAKAYNNGELAAEGEVTLAMR
jgi:3-hydroxyacyl-[acyl-carrier-protein] dehydratase